MKNKSQEIQKIAKNIVTKVDEAAGKLKISEEDMKKALDSLYDGVITGIPKISKPIDKLVEEYLNKNTTLDDAVKDFIKYQVMKCGISGFITGLGGLITIPVAVPANVSSVLFVQLRMIAAIAAMGGFDINSDQVQTLAYACLTGSAMADILKQGGIKAGMKIAEVFVGKIPGKVLQQINKKVGLRLITKFGEKGIVNIGKMIPLVGGIVGGGMDVVSTNIIANNAYNLFIKKQIPKK